MARLTSEDLSKCHRLTELAPLAALPHLATLDLSGCNGITDRGLAAGAPGSPRPVLGRVQDVTRAGLASLLHLTKRTKLDLHSCVNVKDDGLEAVSRLGQVLL